MGAISSMNESDPRFAVMLSLSQSGLPLAEIGKRFGITRERVRQIIGESQRKYIPKPVKWPTRYWHQTMLGWMNEQGYRKCSDCKLWKSDVTLGKRCRGCARIHTIQWAAENPKQWRKLRRDYYDRLKQTPEGRERLRGWYRAAYDRRKKRIQKEGLYTNECV
jgi:hypothetical protein